MNTAGRNIEWCLGGVELTKSIFTFAFFLALCSAAFGGDVFDQVKQKKHLATSVSPASAFDDSAAKDMLLNGMAVMSGILSFVEPIYVPDHKKAIDQREGFWFGGEKPRVFVAGRKVALYPDSAYLREYLDLVKTSKREVVASDRFYAHSMSTTTDQYGQFEFKGLKAGKYYVIATDVVLKRKSNVMVPTQVDNLYLKQNFTHAYDVLMSYGDFVEIRSNDEELKVDARMLVKSTQFIN